MSSRQPYPVITRGVIKSALSWHGIPAPEMKLTYNFTWPDLSMSCEYLLTWSQPVIEKVQGERIPHDGSAAYQRFKERLIDSFCHDITVTEMFSNQGEKILVRLYCKMPAKQRRDYLQPVTGA